MQYTRFKEPKHTTVTMEVYMYQPIYIDIYPSAKEK